jgi:hypothetical protein
VAEQLHRQLDEPLVAVHEQLLLMLLLLLEVAAAVQAAHQIQDVLHDAVAQVGQVNSKVIQGQPGVVFVSMISQNKSTVTFDRLKQAGEVLCQPAVGLLPHVPRLAERVC